MDVTDDTSIKVGFPMWSHFSTVTKTAVSRWRENWSGAMVLTAQLPTHTSSQPHHSHRIRTRPSLPTGFINATQPRDSLTSIFPAAAPEASAAHGHLRRAAQRRSEADSRSTIGALPEPAISRLRRGRLRGLHVGVHPTMENFGAWCMDNGV